MKVPTTTFYIELTDQNTTIAFQKAQEKASSILYEVDPQTNYYAYDIVLLTTTYKYYDFGERSTWEYKFKLRERR